MLQRLILWGCLLGSPGLVLAQGASPPPASPPDAAPTPAATTNLPPIGALVRVELTSGDTLRGNLVSADAETIVLQLPAAGRITLQRSTVEAIEIEDRATTGDDGRIYRRDPNRTRYLYGPSALSLEAGEGYVSQKELFFTAVAYGVTDNITVLGGTVLPAIFGGEFMGIVATKFSYEVVEDVFHVATGGEAFLASFDDFGAIGFLFVNATYGNADRHLTLTVGKPFQLHSDSRSLGPAIITASGAYRLAPRFMLVTENWFIVSDENSDFFRFNGIAGRFIWDNWALDIGGIFFHDAEFPLPWIDLTYNW